MAWLPAVPPTALYSGLALGSIIVTPVHPAGAVLSGLTPAGGLEAYANPAQFNVLPAPPVSLGPNAVGYAH